jgi:hypothetical protein
LLAGYDYDCSDQVIKDVVIPLAVAATVAIITEATQVDDSGYYALADSLSKFEKVPATNATTNAPVSARVYSAQSTTSTVDETVDPHDTMGFRLVSGQQRAEDAKNAFIAGQTTLEQFLGVMFEERAKARAIQSGISLDAAALTQIANAEVNKMKAIGQFFHDGSLPKLAQAKACAELPAATANQLSADEITDLQARCNGTKDSDGDGVPDLRDECVTSASLLASGATVGVDGCVYGDSHRLQIDRSQPNTNAMILPRGDAGAP